MRTNSSQDVKKEKKKRIRMSFSLLVPKIATGGFIHPKMLVLRALASKVV